MNTVPLILSMLVAMGLGLAQLPDAATQQFSVPEPVRAAIATGPLAGTYEVSFHLNPFYLRGDFNGDRRADVAFLVKEQATGKTGIAIVHAGSAQVVVLGAGVRDSRGDDDYAWMDYWYVYPKGRVGRGVGERAIARLRGEALYVGKSEASSGLFYWNGKRYTWYQQGD